MVECDQQKQIFPCNPASLACSPHIVIISCKASSTSSVMIVIVRDEVYGDGECVILARTLLLADNCMT